MFLEQELRWRHLDGKLKLVLVVPNLRWCDGDESTFWHFVPYNLCLLAAMVEDICDVRIVDAHIDNMDEDCLRRRLAALGPDVVGVTVMMDQFAGSGHKVCEIAKSALSGVITVMGGVYATVNSEKLMQDSNVDFVCVGEGEYVLRRLIQYFLGKDSIPAKGICYRKDKETINTGRSDFIDDLDALSLPAYHLIDFERYSRAAERKSVDSPREFPYARIFSSRGCPQKCIFCQVEHIAGKRFRARSAQNVLDEISWLQENFGVKSLIFDDDNLFANRKRALKLFRGMIDRRLSLRWVSISTAVFLLDEEMLSVMRESGCEYICVAIESGSERILKDIIQKPVEFSHAKKMVSMARKAGIYVAANFIIGFPTETWDEIRQTVRFAEALGADYVKLFHAIPLENTRLWDLCVEKKAFKDGFDHSALRWSTGQIETDAFTSEDLTLLRAYEWDRINFTTVEKRKKTARMMGISCEELLRIRRRTLTAAQNNICSRQLPQLKK